MRIKTKTGMGVVLSAAVVMAVSGQAVGQVCVSSPIAMTGTDGPLGPGLGLGVFFGNNGSSTLGSAVAAINNSGQVVFRGGDNAATPNNGLYVYSGGVNSQVASNGQTVSGYTYGNSGFNAPIINNAGNTAWRYSTTALFSNTGSASLTAKTAALAPVQVAPDTGGATFTSFSFPAPLMNGVGESAFVGSLTTGTGSPAVTITPSATANAGGLWSGAPGNVHLRARQNDLYPGSVTADDLRLGTFGTSVAINDSGSILFPANLQGTVNSTSGSTNNGAILKYTTGGGVAVVARRGAAAPGSPGEFYNNIGSTTTLDMNNAGRVVFNSSLRNAATAGTQTAASALFSDTMGSLTMVARAGNAMPSITGAVGSEFGGVNWGTVFSNNYINSSGKLLFQNSGMTGTGVTSANSSAYFEMNAFGDFIKVARQGDIAIGATSTVVGDTVKFNGFQSNPAFNALGQVVFSTLLTSTLGGVNGAIGNNLGLFAADPVNGTLCLVAQKGTLFHVGPGDDRTVQAIGGINAGGGEDGRATSLNDWGQLVFSLDFTDGTSGVFVTAVPAPGAAGLLALGGLAAARRRRR